MKKQLILYGFCFFLFTSCSWNKPKKGDYIIEMAGVVHDPTNGDIAYSREYEVTVTQSRIKHITITAKALSFSDSGGGVLEKKGKRVSGTINFSGGGLGATSTDTYRLDGNMIISNRNCVITGTYKGDIDYKGSPGPFTYYNYYEGTFKMRQK